jgi:ATP-dependent Clp protease ATP-binding subunit ClpA
VRELGERVPMNEKARTEQSILEICELVKIDSTDVARLRQLTSEYLAAARYDPQYGARPLKWAIRKELETSLSKLLLKGEVGDGQTVVVDADAARGITFQVKSGAESQPRISRKSSLIFEPR